jgi:hypothetical protein
MKKRLALLGLTLIFVLASALSGAFAPLVASYVAQASSNPQNQPNVANYAIEHLPKKSHQVGDPVPVNRPKTSTGVFYTITRQVSNRHIVMGVSHTRYSAFAATGFGAGNALPDPMRANHSIEDSATHAAGCGTTPTFVNHPHPDCKVIMSNHPSYNRTRLVGHTDGFHTFSLEGTYTYNFYSEEEFRKLRFVVLNGQNTGMVTGATSFHTYGITVYSTNFNIELPENDRDIFPNVIIPNNRLTLPLPKSMFDLKGRDLLDMDKENTDAEEARREAYLPGLKKFLPNGGEGHTDKALMEFFFEDETKISGLIDDYDDDTDNEAGYDGRPNYKPALPINGGEIGDTGVYRKTLLNLIYRDLRIDFYGNPTRESNEMHTSSNTGNHQRVGTPAPGTTLGQVGSNIGIQAHQNRIFTPITDGGNYYAVYSYKSTFNDIEASFRTSNITVERPLAVNTATITDQNARQHLLLNTIPEISFTPSEGSFRIGTQATLPTATVSIHEDSEIKFDGTNVLANYTYIAVRYREKTAVPEERQWRWLGTKKDANDMHEILPAGTRENNDDILRIDNFKFTPERVGDYQFFYYTTTILGIGIETDIPNERIRTRSINGETRRFIRNQPFLNITIERDNLAPEIMWTDDYAYYSDIGASSPTHIANPSATNAGKPALAGGATELTFENAVDRSKMLPGSTTSSKTRIKRGESLVIPAVLGIDNATPSSQLNYQLFLYRYQDGIRSENYIFWSSGLNGNDPNRNGVYPNDFHDTSLRGKRIWEHNKTFLIPFDGNNITFQSNDRLLSAFHGFSVVGRYDIMVRAYDSENNISGQYQYTFEVVDQGGTNPVVPSRPRSNGFRAGQNEYHEGDTLRFTVATFSDTYTDDRDIEVRYFLSLGTDGKDIERLLNDPKDTPSGTHAVEIKDGEKGMKVSGGVASIELKDDNEAGRYILDELNFKWKVGDWYPTRIEDQSGVTAVRLTAGASGVPGAGNAGVTHNSIIGTDLHNGHLTFRIYAIARNYHALTRITQESHDTSEDVIGYEVGRTYEYYTDTINFDIDKISRPATANPAPPNYITAVFDSVTIFDLKYGSAAAITDKFGARFNNNQHDITRAVHCGQAACIANGCTNTTPCVGTVSSWYAPGTVLHQDDEIAIPALRFFYPNRTDTSALYSTITYSVSYKGFTRDARSYNAQGRPIGGGWQGMLGRIGEVNPTPPHAPTPGETNRTDAPIPAIGAQTGINGRTFGTTVGSSTSDAQKRAANQRFFTPMGVGEHLITVKVTNAGGNVSVFVGRIMIVGTPHATSRLLNERTTPMRIGEAEKMPTVEVTIDGVKYVTGGISGTNNFQGYIVTQDIDTRFTPHRQARVGTFHIEFGSENSSEPAIISNNFVPSAVDTYWFTYVISIQDNIEFNGAGGIIANLDPAIRTTPALAITRTETWNISVGPIHGADIIVTLDGRPYSDLAHGDAWHDGAPVQIGGEMNAYYDAHTSNIGDWYDTRQLNVHNFFTDMLDANAENQLLEMTDAQLLGGLEPFIPTDRIGDNNFIPVHWQYGKIFVPNDLARLSTDLSWLGEDFTKNATQYITVTKGGTTLLDTREDSDTAGQIEFGFSKEGFAWFRPTGLVTREDINDMYKGGTAAAPAPVHPSGGTSANPTFAGSRLEWAMKNAQKKAEWDPVATANNNFLKVDGEYVITYHVEYMGISLPEPKAYRIAMGDTRQPRITLRDDTDTKDKFTRTYRVGDKFSFNTGDLEVTGTKDPDVFLFDKGMESWLANSQRNERFTITIHTYGGQVLSPTVYMKKINGSEELVTQGLDDGHKYEIIIDEETGKEQHTFQFRDAETYYLNFRVTSKSGVTGNREYRLNVEARTPRDRIAPETVWGTILIILSVGLLAGVVIYFVRTGQQTKFATVKTKQKKPGKAKEDEDGGVV